MYLCILCFFIIFLLEIAGSLRQQELFIHIIFLISEDFATTEYFINHTKKGGLLKPICMFKVSNIYIYIYIYIYYTYELYLIQIRVCSFTEERIGRIPCPTRCKFLLPTRKIPLVDPPPTPTLYPS